jgi:hypothetical protein
MIPTLSQIFLKLQKVNKLIKYINSAKIVQKIVQK